MYVSDSTVTVHSNCSDKLDVMMNLATYYVCKDIAEVTGGAIACPLFSLTKLS